MSRHKISEYQKYTYDPQTQVDECLQCRRSQAECNVCSANPKAEHRFKKDDKIIELWQRGLYDREIAEIMNIPQSTVGRIRLKHSLPPNQRPRCQKVNRDKLFGLWQSGATDEEIASTLGCTKQTVRHLRSEPGLPAQSKRGEIK